MIEFELGSQMKLSGNKRENTVLKDLYGKIVFFEWFAVAGLTSWLLMLFVTILH